MTTLVIRKEQNKITTWSGGTTSQVYIYPENADYKERNFLFRLSMAVAQIEDSVYTELPGVTRYLASLSGDCELEHEKTGHFHLKEFGNIDCFDGGELTRAHGAIRDFNLMLRGGAVGEMLIVKDAKQPLQSRWTHIAFYTDEPCTSFVKGTKTELGAGDCIIFADITDDEEVIFTCDSMKLLRCNIALPG